jgi:hypothetical protein
LVLFDPTTVRLTPPKPRTWGHPAVSVRFTQNPDVIPQQASSLDPSLGAGCPCSAAQVKQGTLRVRLQDAGLIVDALCGHIWHPVHQQHFLYEKRKTLDETNPAARSAVLDVVKHVVTRGWSKRSGCN